MATGVAPRGELAAPIDGIELADGAIPVSADMRSARADVLAAGDVCRAENVAAGRPLRVEHWGDALAQGEIAGATAAGKQAAWDQVPGFWSDDRLAHAEVRGLGRRLRPGAVRAPRRRRLHGLVRA